jgi:hypothetical protein
VTLRDSLSLLTAVFLICALCSGCTATGSGTKTAGTKTLVGAVKDKTEDGSMQIKGDTDAAPLP